MIDIFTTVTKSLKINKLHVFPLNIPKFEPQRETFIGKGSLINHTLRSRECHGWLGEEKFLFTFLCLHEHLSAFNISTPATL